MSDFTEKLEAAQSKKQEEINEQLQQREQEVRDLETQRKIHRDMLGVDPSIILGPEDVMNIKDFLRVMGANDHQAAENLSIIGPEETVQEFEVGRFGKKKLKREYTRDTVRPTKGYIVGRIPFKNPTSYGRSGPILKESRGGGDVVYLCIDEKLRVYLYSDRVGTPHKPDDIQIGTFFYSQEMDEFGHRSGAYTIRDGFLPRSLADTLIDLAVKAEK